MVSSAIVGTQLTRELTRVTVAVVSLFYPV